MMDININTVLDTLEEKIIDEDVLEKRYGVSITPEFKKLLKEGIIKLNKLTGDLEIDDPYEYLKYRNEFLEHLTNPDNHEFFVQLFTNSKLFEKEVKLKEILRILYYNIMSKPIHELVILILLATPEIIKRKIFERTATVIWIGGISGSGKTVLTDLLCDTLNQIHKVICSYMMGGFPREEIYQGVKEVVETLSPIFIDVFGDNYREKLDLDSFSKNFVDNFFDYLARFGDQIDINEPYKFDIYFRIERALRSGQIRRTERVRLRDIYPRKSSPIIKIDDLESSLSLSVLKYILQSLEMEYKGVYL